MLAVDWSEKGREFKVEPVERQQKRLRDFASLKTNKQTTWRCFWTTRLLYGNYMANAVSLNKNEIGKRRGSYEEGREKLFFLI